MNSQTEPLPQPNALKIAQARFQQCQLLREFLDNRLRPRLDAAQQARPSDTFFGLFLRAQAWIRTLSKLNGPSDFQAVTAGSRALFEIAVDLTLLHLDATNHPLARLTAWEESAKLKSAQITQAFLATQGVLPPSEAKPMIEFVRKESTRIEALRAAHWPSKNSKGRHPSRWTGLDLGSDADKAELMRPDAEFAAYYKIRYPQVCWNTHGSGLAGIRSLRADLVPGIAATAFGEAYRFGLLAGELALAHFGLWSDEVAAEFESHKSEALVMMHDTMFGADATAALKAATSEGRADGVAK